ncbi:MULTISPECIES: hypothetical protein [unclassified Thioalkalivibrio]|uniref:hypothetical protein n=1 Tax=unclassified Thioalkalivibrio TaxID=2621013 RepID=UPI0003800926|nr:MULTISPECIES: hypothetical protein [unclassified Thioalkalivibrio]
MYGKIAFEYFGHHVELQPMASAKGWYVGTADPLDGTPLSRESLEYFATEEATTEALNTGAWTQRAHP